jgi:hypothetical protein
MAGKRQKGLLLKFPGNLPITIILSIVLEVGRSLAHVSKLNVLLPKRR